MENIDNNTFMGNEEFEEYEFKLNFINTPWDDRSNKSKIGIIALLLAIFFATAACVANSFFMHYRDFESKKYYNTSEINCQMVTMSEYPFAVRIHSIESQDLLCIGALIGDGAILANGACVKSGPIRLRMGNLNEPRCKKGFSVDVIEPIPHEGVISKKLVLLFSQENIGECASSMIPISSNIKTDSRAYIIGRTLHGEKSLSRQSVIVAGKECSCAGVSTKNLNSKSNIICVKSLAKCPILAGDLLVQDGHLYGLASTSVRRRDENKLACFADLKAIRKELKELSNIDVN